jgi:hypothetical protein
MPERKELSKKDILITQIFFVVLLMLAALCGVYLLVTPDTEEVSPEVLVEDCYEVNEPNEPNGIKLGPEAHEHIEVDLKPPEVVKFKSSPDDYYAIEKHGSDIHAIPNDELFEEHLKKYLPDVDLENTDIYKFIEGRLLVTLLLLEQRIKALEGKQCGN